MLQFSEDLVDVQATLAITVDKHRTGAEKIPDFDPTKLTINAHTENSQRFDELKPTTIWSLNLYQLSNTRNVLR